MKKKKERIPFRIVHENENDHKPYKKGDLVKYYFIGSAMLEATIKSVSKSPNGEYMYAIDKTKKGVTYETHVFHSDIKGKLEI